MLTVYFVPLLPIMENLILILSGIQPYLVDHSFAFRAVIHVSALISYIIRVSHLSLGNLSAISGSDIRRVVVVSSAIVSHLKHNLAP